MAQTQKITISRALNTLKHLKVEIEDYFKTTRQFAGIQFGASGANTNIASMNAEQLKAAIRSNYDKITGLIRKQVALKQAIALANTTTMVTVDGKTMSVANAIIMRNHINAKEVLLKQMRGVNASLNTELEKIAVKFEDRVAVLTKESMSDSMSSEERANVALTMRRIQEEQAGPRAINPLNLAEKIQELEKEILFLKSELDLVLNESNTNTLVEVEA